MVALSRKTWLAALASVALVLALAACAPAADAPAVGVEGVDVGNTSPPFAMTLTDGSEVALKDIVDGNQPTHLFWFATW